jgi:RNA polymerase sigma factor (TIGR02999 family)
VLSGRDRAVLERCKFGATSETGGILVDTMDRLEPIELSEKKAGEMTRLLEEAAEGRQGAIEKLFPLVYTELRSMASVRMASERPDHTLQPTALVNEAYVRMMGVVGVAWKSRAQFFYAAAEAMRRILIDHARSRNRLKRELKRRELRELESLADLAEYSNLQGIMAVDDAVRRLEEQSAEVGSVVKLRFYAGLSPQETASATGFSLRKVYRHWAYARAWLYRELSQEI